MLLSKSCHQIYYPKLRLMSSSVYRTALIKVPNDLTKCGHLVKCICDSPGSVFEFGANHCCSVTKSCLTLFDPMDCSTPGFSALHHLPEFAQICIHWVSDAVQPSHSLLPLLLLPSIFPSIGGFSNKSALCIKWPKYWSWSFSISPCSELSELISFRNDWFDLLAVQRTLKSLLQYT